MGGFNQTLLNAELWPIKAKGAVTRYNPLGDPAIEKIYHQSLEGGRYLERNIADAQHWLAQKQKDLIEKILIHTRVNSLAVDGQLSNPPRAIKFVADSIKILQDINTFQKEIISLIQAVEQNITILQNMLLSILNMANQNLMALTHLMQQICNWHLPALPSLPNLLPDSIWHWNGVAFAPLATFENILSSLKNIESTFTSFSFSQCNLILPISLTNQPAPSSVSTYGGLNLGTTLINPPLSGTISTGSPTDPVYIASMQQLTTPPVFLSPAEPATGVATPFNTNTSMLGAVPDPSTIISDYQMPAATYQSNIVSIVPQLRPLTVEPTDADYANPNLAVRNPELQKALVQYVNLGQVVASNYDPNLTAAWLFYLNLNRVGRLGSWLTNFQVAYVSLISPSLTYLATNDVPWNAVLPSATVNDTPTAIPLIATLTNADPVTQGNLLWQLSYIEAGLIGYTRNQTWDAYASVNYVSSFTGTDLDYRETTLNSTVTTTVTLGEGETEYPVTCTFPSAMGNVMQQVIAIADENIQNTPTYTTTRPQFKFIYNQFAIATEVDRFAQFWRTFNANLQALLLQDPYLVQFVVSYPASLDSAIDPLGTPAIFNQVQADASTRNRNWTPGSDLLSIPVAPVVSYSTSSGPAAGQDGWAGTTFNPSTFLSRPDIQQLPIPTQLAMLRTNLSYSIVQTAAATAQSAIQDSIQQSQLLLQSFQNVGFKAESLSAINSIPVGLTGAHVAFDKTDLDLTGNITNPSTFTIQTAGNYAMIVVVNWEAGAAGTRTVSLAVNGTVISTYSTTEVQTAPTLIQLSAAPFLNVGDVVTVMASHDLNTAQFIAAGSYISATLTDTSAPVPTTPVPPTSTGQTQTFPAGSTIAPLTAVIVSSTGSVTPVDPTTVQEDSGNPIYPIVTGISLTAGTVGENITVACSYGGIYQVPGAQFTVGALFYAITGGYISQDYSLVFAPPTSSPPVALPWVVVVGRAITANSFIFEPHIPNLS